MSNKNRKPRKNQRRQKTASAPPKPSDQTFSTKLFFWLGGIASIIAILTFALDLPKKLSENSQPASSLLYGTVKDQNGAPVANADMFALEKPDGDTLGIGKSGADGDFSFTVKARPETSVFLEVKQNGDAGFRGHVTLAAGKKIPFKRE